MFQTLKSANIKHLNFYLFLNGRRLRAAKVCLEAGGWSETPTLVSLSCSPISHETHQSPSKRKVKWSVTPTLSLYQYKLKRTFTGQPQHPFIICGIFFVSECMHHLFMQNVIISRCLSGQTHPLLTDTLPLCHMKSGTWIIWSSLSGKTSEVSLPVSISSHLHTTHTHCLWGEHWWHCALTQHTFGERF
jgi:hypothetical protein